MTNATFQYTPFSASDFGADISLILDNYTDNVNKKRFEVESAIAEKILSKFKPSEITMITRPKFEGFEIRDFVTSEGFFVATYWSKTETWVDNSLEVKSKFTYQVEYVEEHFKG